MNLFDRLLDAFSARDLKRRIWTVVLIGICILVATAIGGTHFLKATYKISIEGTGKVMSLERREIEIQINKGEEKRLRPVEPIVAEVPINGGETISLPVRVLSVEPQTGEVVVDTPEIPEKIRDPNRFNVRLILLEKPFWKLLWGMSNE